MGGEAVLTAEPHWAGAPIAAVAADTPGSARRGRRRARARARGACRRSTSTPASRSSASPRSLARPCAATRTAAIAAGRGDRRADLRDARPRPDTARAARGRRTVGRRPPHRVGLDAGHVRCATRAGDRGSGSRTRASASISEFIGGGFGAKQGAGVEALLAAELARAAGRPVRLALSRHEDQVVGGRRARTRQTVTLASRGDGSLQAIELAAVVEMGAGGWVFPVAEPALSLYACANVRAMVFPVRTSLRAQNAFRAPGVVEGVDGPRPGDGRARVAASASTRSSSAAEITSTPTRGRGFRTPASACSPATTGRPSWPAGPIAKRSVSRTPTGCSAAWGARRRSGGEAGDHPRTRRFALMRTGGRS